jgi:NhaP-type Na+/H+ or K+/H+ antiporter
MEKAPAFMMQAVLGFNEQLERIGEMAAVLLIGSMLTPDLMNRDSVLLIPIFLLVIRPISEWGDLVGSTIGPQQRRLMSWFGIRGVGSIYYLMFAINHGLPASLAHDLTRLTLATVAVSIIVHGLSVTRLMNAYSRVRARTRPRSAARMVNDM